jgi:RNA polymerase sigma-70 factor (ECF subfamily)
MARTDEELVASLKKGRGEASLRALYGQHADALYGFALARLGDTGLAEELVQDVFTRIWRHADDFNPARGSFRTWMYGIARNAVIDVERRRAVRPPLADASEGEDPSGEPIELAILRWQIRSSLDRLSPEHREIIRLVRLQGLTLVEAAERTRLPLGTVKSRLSYALRALRLALEEAGVVP